MSRRKPPAAATVAPPRVVFDTGVLLRALLLPGEEGATLRRAWQDGRCQALVDAASARALMMALAAPALKLAPAERQELLADFLPYAEVVTATRTAPRATPRVGARPGPVEGLDGLALGLAQAGCASLLVSDSAALHARLRTHRPPAAGAYIEALESAEFFAVL